MRGGGVEVMNLFGGEPGVIKGAFTMKGSATVTPEADTPGKHKNGVFLPVNAKITIVGELKPVGGTASRRDDMRRQHKRLTTL